MQQTNSMFMVVCECCGKVKYVVTLPTDSRTFICHTCLEKLYTELTEGIDGRS